MKNVIVNASLGVCLMGILAVSPALFAVGEVKQPALTAVEIQVAIEAFGVVPNEAERAAQISMEMIEKIQQPAKINQRIAIVPDNLLELSPY